jgi:tRNA dimethylallyltransferase
MRYGDEAVGVAASPLIAIVGPTGVGKTGLALALAREVGAEVVSADSRQVYRGMDIGTDKPSEEQRQLVPHHLIDIFAPDEDFTLAQYQERAYDAIEDILSRGKVPFLVGGTGLYVRAVLEGFVIPRVRPNPALRQALLQEAERDGQQALHARLQGVDPEAAARLDPRNVRRVIRALEVYEELRTPISELQARKAPPYRTLKIGLTRERQELYRRIDRRVDRMVERGLIAEVQALVVQGYGFDLPAMSGLGYRQIGMHVRGEVDLPTAVRMIKSETHRFVRQQYKWFRLDDQTIRWFDMGKAPYEEVKVLVAGFLKQQGLYRDSARAAGGG